MGLPDSASKNIDFPVKIWISDKPTIFLVYLKHGLATLGYNSIAINIQICVILWTRIHSSVGYIPRSELLSYNLCARSRSADTSGGYSNWYWNYSNWYSHWQWMIWLPVINIVSPFNLNQSDGYAVVSHCCLYLHFPDD